MTSVTRSLRPTFAPNLTWVHLGTTTRHYRGFTKKGISHFEVAFLKNKYQISNPVLLVKSGLILGTVVVLSLLYPLHHIETAWLACVGALGLMVIATPHEVQHVFQHIEVYY
jgi:Na+/H+ antiporter NhaD/arsenite permease-like protein